MIRRSTFTLKYANQSKIIQLDNLMGESIRVINLYVDCLWNGRDRNYKYIDFKVKTWLSSRMQQCLGKQAWEIIKSQRKKNKKTKPTFKKHSLNLDQRFFQFAFNINSFDVWFHLSSIGNKLILNLPSKKHKQFLSLTSKGFELKKSVRLRKTKGIYEIDLFLKKDTPPEKIKGKSIGFDCGYKKLLVDSNGKVWDKGLELIYEKISRRKHKSKGFYKSLIERDNLINQTINSIPFSSIKTVIVEDLKNVKKGSRGKIRKTFNNKLQRWSYLKVLDKLSMICEENGISFVKVEPSYTSQTCNYCGKVDKKSRKGEIFLCTSCGMEMDADFNAAINILHRGVYSPSTMKYQ